MDKKYDVKFAAALCRLGLTSNQVDELEAMLVNCVHEDFKNLLNTAFEDTDIPLVVDWKGDE